MQFVGFDHGAELVHTKISKPAVAAVRALAKETDMPFNIVFNTIISKGLESMSVPVKKKVAKRK